MLTVRDVADYVETNIDVGQGISCGIIDNAKNTYIGIFDNTQDLSASDAQPMSFGESENDCFYKRKISALIHWGKEFSQAESKAYDLYKLFRRASDFMIGTSKIIMCIPGIPDCLGRTSDGTVEYAVPIEIFVSKEE